MNSIGESIESAIYCYYSNNLSLSVVTYVLIMGKETLTGHKEYHYSTNRALLAGFIEMVLSGLKTTKPIILYTDNTYFANTWNKLEEYKNNGWKLKNNNVLKNQDMIKLIYTGRLNLPNLEIQYIDENNLLDACKLAAIKILKNKSYVQKYVENHMMQSIPLVK